ncbi:MAG: 1,2-diacylglycerol 3-alpha-glucosyltransferase [Euryarchaeota archaeon]|nr:1,2-diacylglycerol 3-alpha-glucosyltransferase [Euryarchaeota archaeon]
MKIAQICPRYSPDIGGVETHVKEISERLVNAGHKVEVITTDPTGRLNKQETINGVKVVRFTSFAPGNAYYLAPQILFYLRSRKYDIIHMHSYHALPALFAALGKGQEKLVFTPHYHRSGHTPFRNLLHKPYRFLGKIIFSRADYVICVSEYEKKLVESDFKVGGKIVKIPNGINLKEFKKIKNQEKNSTEKILLYVGRLEEYKGIQYIIQSLPELQEFRLKVIGKGPFESELHDIAKNLQVENKIEWLKELSREELLDCYADADIFLMLSTHEAYGITVAEALASGTPCIVAKGSALEEFVDGIHCFGLDEPNNKKSIIKLIHQAENLKNNSEFIVEKLNIFDWNQITEEIENVYRKQTLAR